MGGERGRRNTGYWAPFNIWWRAHLEKYGERPKAEDLKRWFHEESHIAFPNEPPTYTMIRNHAKGLRDIASVKHYFRDYRARKRRAVADLAGAPSPRSEPEPEEEEAGDSGAGSASGTESGCTSDEDWKEEARRSNIRDRRRKRQSAKSGSQQPARSGSQLPAKSGSQQPSRMQQQQQVAALPGQLTKQERSHGTLLGPMDRYAAGPDPPGGLEDQGDLTVTVTVTQPKCLGGCAPPPQPPQQQQQHDASLRPFPPVQRQAPLQPPQGHPQQQPQPYQHHHRRLPSSGGGPSFDEPTAGMEDPSGLSPSGSLGLPTSATPGTHAHMGGSRLLSASGASHGGSVTSGHAAGDRWAAGWRSMSRGAPGGRCGDYSWPAGPTGPTGPTSQAQVQARQLRAGSNGGAAGHTGMQQHQQQCQPLPAPSQQQHHHHHQELQELQLGCPAQQHPHPHPHPHQMPLLDQAAGAAPRDSGQPPSSFRTASALGAFGALGGQMSASLGGDSPHHHPPGGAFARLPGEHQAMGAHQPVGAFGLDPSDFPPLPLMPGYGCASTGGAAEVWGAAAGQPTQGAPAGAAGGGRGGAAAGAGGTGQGVQLSPMSSQPVPPADAASTASTERQQQQQVGRAAGHEGPGVAAGTAAAALAPALAPRAGAGAKDGEELYVGLGGMGSAFEGTESLPLSNPVSRIPSTSTGGAGGVASQSQAWTPFAIPMSQGVDNEPRASNTTGAGFDSLAGGQGSVEQGSSSVPLYGMRPFAEQTRGSVVLPAPGSAAAAAAEAFGPNDMHCGPRRSLASAPCLDGGIGMSRPSWLARQLGQQHPSLMAPDERHGSMPLPSRSSDADQPFMPPFLPPNSHSRLEQHQRHQAQPAGRQMSVPLPELSYGDRTDSAGLGFPSFAGTAADGAPDLLSHPSQQHQQAAAAAAAGPPPVTTGFAPSKGAGLRPGAAVSSGSAPAAAGNGPTGLQPAPMQAQGPLMGHAVLTGAAATPQAAASALAPALPQAPQPAIQPSMSVEAPAASGGAGGVTSGGALSPQDYATGPGGSTPRSAPAGMVGPGQAARGGSFSSRPPSEVPDGAAGVGWSPVQGPHHPQPPSRFKGSALPPFPPPFPGGSASALAAPPPLPTSGSGGPAGGSGGGVPITPPPAATRVRYLSYGARVPPPPPGWHPYAYPRPMPGYPGPGMRGVPGYPPQHMPYMVRRRYPPPPPPPPVPQPSQQLHHHHHHHHFQPPYPQQSPLQAPPQHMQLQQQQPASQSPAPQVSRLASSGPAASSASSPAWPPGGRSQQSHPNRAAALGLLSQAPWDTAGYEDLRPPGLAPTASTGLPSQASGGADGARGMDMDTDVPPHHMDPYGYAAGSLEPSTPAGGHALAGGPQAPHAAAGGFMAGMSQGPAGGAADEPRGPGGAGAPGQCEPGIMDSLWAMCSAEDDPMSVLFGSGDFGSGGGAAGADIGAGSAGGAGGGGRGFGPGGMSPDGGMVGQVEGPGTGPAACGFTPHGLPHGSVFGPQGMY